MGGMQESRNQGVEAEAGLLTITPSDLLEEFGLFVLTKLSSVNLEVLVPKGEDTSGRRHGDCLFEVVVWPIHGQF